MKKKDLILLSNFRQDARMSLTKMSKKTNVPISTIFDKLKMFEKDLIKKHTTLLDFSKLGYNTRVNVAIKCDRSDRDALKSFLVCNENVNSVYKINNGYDYMIEGIFVHIKDLDEFFQRLEDKFKIQDKQIYYVVDELKREEFMSNPELVQAMN